MPVSRLSHSFECLNGHAVASVVKSHLHPIHKQVQNVICTINRGETGLRNGRQKWNYHPLKSPNPPAFFCFFSCPPILYPPVNPALPTPAVAVPLPTAAVFAAAKYFPTETSSSSPRFRLASLSSRFVPSHVVLSCSRFAFFAAR